MNWWYTVEGITNDGIRIEVWLNGLKNWDPVSAPYSMAKPKDLGSAIGNHRWVKYYEYVNWGNAIDITRLNFGRYICREYNARHSAGKRLWKFNLIFHAEETNLEGLPPYPLEDSTFWSHECYERITNPHFKGTGVTPEPLKKG